MATLRVGALRPYSRRIRSRVFEALETLGAEVAVLAPAGTPDGKALRAVRRARFDVLLIPFNAHRDSAGDGVHGLTLIERLRSEPAYAQIPIICPISNVGLAAADLVTSRQEGDGFSGVLFLREDDLNSALAETITAFLRQQGIHKRLGR